MKKSHLILIVLGLLVGVVNPATSSPYFLLSEKSPKHKRQHTISASQAASKVKSRFGGKVLKVSSAGNGYRVKLIKPDGRIISVFVDGVTGQIKG